MFHPGLVSTPDEAARAAMYRDYVRSVADHPLFVGCHFFKFNDEPLTGRPKDGENYTIGFTTLTDSVYRSWSWPPKQCIARSTLVMHAPRRTAALRIERWCPAYLTCSGAAPQRGRESASKHPVSSLAASGQKNRSSYSSEMVNPAGRGSHGDPARPNRIVRRFRRLRWLVASHRRFFGPSAGQAHGAKSRESPARRPRGVSGW